MKAETVLDVIEMARSSWDNPFPPAGTRTPPVNSPRFAIGSASPNLA